MQVTLIGWGLLLVPMIQVLLNISTVRSSQAFNLQAVRYVATSSSTSSLQQYQSHYRLSSVPSLRRVFGSVTTSLQASSDPSSSSSSSSSSENSGSNNNFSDTNYVNGEGGRISKNSNNDQRRYPKTGWNHKLPSEDSDFWQSPTSSKETQKQQQSESNPLRTGWLHNKQPASEVYQKQQQQQQKRSLTTTTTTTASSSTPVARLRLQQAMKDQTINHRIVSPPTFHTSPLGKRGIVVTEHYISVPLYRNTTDGTPDPNKQQQRIDVYFTIVEAVDSDEDYIFFQSLQTKTPTQRANDYVQKSGMKNADSMILYLQGGPGFGAPTPITGLSFGSGSSSWAAKALESSFYKRIVLMDQRGTGKSSPVTKQTLEILYPNLFLLDNNKGADKTLDDYRTSQPDEVAIVEKSVNDVTDDLSQFRADNIVWDAEDIREALLQKPNLDTPEGVEEASNPSSTTKPIRPWGASLGQSYGGFCSMTYLSKVPYPPKVMLFTGGIAPMLATDLKVVYSKFCDRVKQRNLLYYKMYPNDVTAVHRIVQKLVNDPQKLPSGGTLTARRFLQIGLMLGSSPSSFASLHNIINNAFVQLPNQKLPLSERPIDELVFRRTFLKDMDSVSSFDDAPFYFWMHESIYADGNNCNPTNWAAYRAYQEKCTVQSTIFDYTITSKVASNDQPTLFTGEMVFPWMVDDYAELNCIGLKEVANALATKDDWSTLYSAEQMQRVLESGTTKAAAAIYYDDMYVDFDESMKLISNAGPMAACKVYITNEYQHSGLRDDGATLFTKLHGMALGTIRTPS